MIINKVEIKSKDNTDNDNKPNPPSNRGTMIVDATCVPSQIKYPQDAELLNEAREIAEKVIDEAERIEVERKFSLAKRKCGIGLIVTRLKNTACHCLAVSVLLLKLRKIGKVFYTNI